ncbi:glucosamine-6-phosphate deaminase [Clavibacter nebraskensis]|uniref:Glucosamine-6-phosphate isomerase n=2 Tax=Clavibacter nebraskensis TaxID=31963 RepID=A0AAI9EJC1_9MICO|nr:glucosamine-6-phosphate deaminase [Clavibacter nebraskensis]QGV65661.1 glucosamine-6-phosphate deaminase [Clavibacter nebraskensis]QGV68457.1 glucosamine-6-phosphate deaminase [Clavibacter nebraskensis]QGV71248.1 glucosamine-6-phosphate deaminase [Clavibacter nebraskensis]UKF28193.1 glucosamine-6-phosphate deaminase [Clavibacter nebraskensis]UQB05309.1 glucosamine-6-phosphate deaminase [Clavibacter nebraskensis]
MTAASTRAPRIQAVGDPAALGAAAADVVQAFLGEDPAGVLGVATGSSPEPLYAELARRHRERGLVTDGLSLVALDEYVGLPAGHPQSYQVFVLARIAGPLGVPSARVIVPDGAADDPREAADEHERRIRRLGGAGLQIVGIGVNGHLGFNEPGSPADGASRVVRLAEGTRQDNARYFGGDPARVPTHAITQGIATIMSAERILLVASGARKADALAAALAGPVTEEVPASILQRHPRVTVVADRAALAGLAGLATLA